MRRKDSTYDFALQFMRTLNAMMIIVDIYAIIFLWLYESYP